MDLDEVAHYEPPHQDLHCLQSCQFPSLTLKIKIGRHISEGLCRP